MKFNFNKTTICFIVVFCAIVALALFPMLTTPAGEDIRVLKNLVHIELRLSLYERAANGSIYLGERHGIFVRSKPAFDSELGSPVLFRGSKIEWSWPPPAGGKLEIYSPNSINSNESITSAYVAKSQQPVHLGKFLFIVMKTGRFGFEFDFADDGKYSRYYQKPNDTLTIQESIKEKAFLNQMSKHNR